MASRTDYRTYNEWVFSLPKQWRHYTSSVLRKDIDWFQSLLRAYDLHVELFLDTLTKSSRERTQIIFPSDTDDETFDNFVLRKHCKKFQCSPTPKQLKGKEKEVNRELCDCIAKCLEKKMVLIKLGQMSLENKSWQSDMQTAIAEKLEVQKLLEDNKVETLRFKDQVEKLTKIVRDIKMEITQERERSSKMSLKLQEITKDKEDLLIRLSKIAGSKLTSNNPDIADLSDDNRPTKLAEKFGQLYDDAWTDSLEELTDVETKLDEGVAIGFLLQIILAAYQFCRNPRSMFLDLTDCQTIMTCANLKDMKVLIKITESSKVDIQPRMKMSLHAKETVSEMQKNFFGILKGIFNDIKRTNKFRPSVSDELNTNSWEVDEVKETNPLDNHFTTNVYKKDVINVLQRSKEEPANMLRHTEFSICKKLSNSIKGDFLQPLTNHFCKN